VVDSGGGTGRIQQQDVVEYRQEENRVLREHLKGRLALTIAAGGHHNILMIGPPGSGKTVYID
jgi:predicted ATPase with chaperone activity